jgi:hypothetical protein
MQQSSFAIFILQLWNDGKLSFFIFFFKKSHISLQAINVKLLQIKFWERKFAISFIMQLLEMARILYDKSDLLEIVSGVWAWMTSSRSNKVGGTLRFSMIFWDLGIKGQGIGMIYESSYPTLN